MLIIGSTALNQNFNTKIRTPKDTDFICTQEEFDACYDELKSENSIKELKDLSSHHKAIFLEDGSILEFIIANGDTNQTLLDKYDISESGVTVASNSVLLLLKESHKYKPGVHFLKTMHDIHFLRSQGVVLDEEQKEILKAREEETYKDIKIITNLKQNKNDFFNHDFYVYEHDDIHEAIKLLDRPAYDYIKPENKDVQVSKALWDQAPMGIRLFSAVEEASVLAIERSLVPHPNTLTPKQAFEVALQKMCTTLTSGWYREFCWENYNKIKALCDPNYFETFQRALEDGKIRKFKHI